MLRDNGIEIFTYKRGNAEDRQKATQEAAYSSDDIAFQIISNGNNEANNDSDTRFQIVAIVCQMKKRRLSKLQRQTTLI